MEFKDYYQVLGVDRSAAADAIKKAYRKLARKYHPDISKEDDAMQRMAEINEAYAVLGDAEKRALYDQVGARAWAQGARSPEDLHARSQAHAGAGSGFQSGATNSEDFSAFFEHMFGGRDGFSGASARSGSQRGADRHARIVLELPEAYQGAERELQLQDLELDEQGRMRPQLRTLKVSIPKGVHEGSVIRLAGHGGKGAAGAADGDLLLEVQFRDDGRWQVEGQDVSTRLRVTPWEAALGAQVEVGMPDGSRVAVSVPAGSGSGRRLRLRGRGIPARSGAGDLYLKLEVAVPGAATEPQRRAWQDLAAAYPGFDPRLDHQMGDKA